MILLGKRKHTPPCSSAELVFAEKNEGYREKTSVVDMVFLVFRGILYPTTGLESFSLRPEKFPKMMFFRWWSCTLYFSILCIKGRADLLIFGFFEAFAFFFQRELANKQNRGGGWASGSVQACDQTMYHGPRIYYVNNVQGKNSCNCTVASQQK